VVFISAVVDIDAIGRSGAIILINPTGELAEVSLAGEFIFGAILRNGHAHVVRITNRQQPPLIFGVKPCVVGAVFLFGDETAQHSVVLIVIAVPSTDPTTLHAFEFLAGRLFPVAIK